MGREGNEQQPGLWCTAPPPAPARTSTQAAPPSPQVILARQYGSEGRFTFTSHTPGEHQICLHSNSTKFSLFAGGMLVSGPWGCAASWLLGHGTFRHIQDTWPVAKIFSLAALRASVPAVAPCASAVSVGPALPGV